MKRQNIKLNFFLQITYQAIILIVPLIVAPYLTRHLGDTNIGIYTFTYTIAYYFALLAMLGINKYGQRIISINSQNDIELRKTFWSLFLAHIIFSITSLCLYIIIISVIKTNDYQIYLIQALYVFSAMFDITWLFYGMENFKSVVIRNVILKVIECAFIFIFVKSPDDLVIYTIIMCASAMIGQLMLFPVAFKYVKPIKVTVQEVVSHFKPLFVFSIMVLASLLYTMFDKTLLGIFSTKENVAYYEYANKLINVPKTLAIVIGSVIYPRACQKYNGGDIESLNKYYIVSIMFVFFISIGSIFGLFGIADEFSIIYYGENFIMSGKIMRALSPIILFITFGNVLQNIYLIPMRKEKNIIIAIVIGAAINLLLSGILVPFLGTTGAIIGTLVSELICLFVQLYFCWDLFQKKATLYLLLLFTLAGGAMYLMIFIAKKFITINTFSVILIILFSFLLYSIILLLVFMCYRSKKARQK